MLALNEILERDGETAANIIDAEGKISGTDEKNCFFDSLKSPEEKKFHG